LTQLRQQLDKLPNARLRKLDELKAQHRQLQLQEFLDRFEVDRATIPNIGPGRKQTLSSYGIETAADISESRVTKVPGFGPVYCARLMDWRDSIVARFRFDPTKPIDPQHATKVEQDILSERRRIEDKLRTGCVELRTIHNQIFAARRQMRPQVEAIYGGYLQATADFDLVANRAQGSHLQRSPTPQAQGGYPHYTAPPTKRASLAQIPSGVWVIGAAILLAIILMNTMTGTRPSAVSRQPSPAETRPVETTPSPRPVETRPSPVDICVNGKPKHWSQSEESCHPR
jgi:hypothetical protein